MCVANIKKWAHNKLLGVGLLLVATPIWTNEDYISRGLLGRCDDWKVTGYEHYTLFIEINMYNINHQGITNKKRNTL